MSERITINAVQARKHARPEGGFSMLQLLIVMAVIAIITSMAIIGTSTAKNSLTLTNETRLLASYLERARIDAITRHGSNSLVINSTTSYSISIDADGSGSAETRTINLSTGVTMSVTNPSTGAAVTLPTTITFDKHGRSSAQTKVSLSMSGSSELAGVMMTGSGDITTNSNVIGPASTTSTTPVTTVSNTAYTKDISH
jgi:Tfp pilus assembly protein FimT